VEISIVFYNDVHDGGGGGDDDDEEDDEADDVYFT
jgi:hypothetical protein